MFGGHFENWTKSQISTFIYQQIDVYSACVVTIMLSSITCMVYEGGYEACHQDLYDPTGEQDLDGFDGFDC